eukprot:1571025-Pleurochrysis_carterae.AAC.2
MLLLPTGKAVRVPHCPGLYVLLDGEQRKKVTLPCWVIFKDNLKRNNELAVAVLDYSTHQGVSQQPS